MNFTLEIITKEGKKHFREINERRRMINSEYLKKVKEEDKGLINEIDKIGNSDYPLNVGRARDIKLTFRKTKALEIIAEELINNNSTLLTLVATLENIETVIIQRG